MEEEKKEECCEIKKSHKHFHGCCGHKIVGVIFLSVVVFVIFSIGVCVGSHINSNREFRGSKQFNFEQRDGGRMMKGNKIQGEVGGCRFQNTETVNSACPMQNVSGVAQPVSGCQMQNQQPVQVQAAPAVQIKTVTPVK